MWSDPARLVVRSATLAVMLLGLWGGRPARAATVSHRHARSRFLIHVGTSVGYDSNILELSRFERRQVGDPAHADKYRIRSVDDILVTPRLEVSWDENLLRQRSTQVSAAFEHVGYVRNQYLARDQFSLDVEQELGRTRRPTMSRIGLSLDRTPRTTLRRLKDDDVSLQVGHVVHQDAFYGADRVRLSGTVELVKARLGLDLGADRQWRDYRSTFDERDGRIDGGDLRLVGVPARTITGACGRAGGSSGTSRAGTTGHAVDGGGHLLGSPDRLG